MSSTTKIFVALLIGTSVATFASLASAAISAKRYAAIERCMKQALAQYPDTTNTDQTARSSVYEACMTAAGENP
jgi:hypothetical protein